MANDRPLEFSRDGLLIQEILLILVDVVQQFSEKDNLTVNLEKVFDFLLSFQDYCAVWIYRKDKVSGKVEFHSYKGLPQPMVDIERASIGENCLIDFVFRTGQPIALKNVALCQHIVERLDTEQLEMQSHLSLPIKEGGQVVGVVNVGCRNRRNFILYEIQFLAILAGLISLLFRLEQSKTHVSNYLERMQDVGLQLLMEKIVDGILLIDKDSRVTLIDPAGRTFLQGFSEIEKGEFFDKFSEIQARIVDDLAISGNEVLELELPLSGPASRVVRVTATPLKRGEAGGEGVLLVVKDITSEKLMALREQIQTRVSSIGSLLEGVTHELNNPLAAVSGYIQMLQRKFSAEAFASDVLGKMDRELNRAIGIVRNFLAIAQQKPIEKVPIQVGPLIENLLEEIKQDFKIFPVQVNFSQEPDLPVLYLELDNMRQVFRSIIESALQKMADLRRAGTLDVTIRKRLDFIQLIFADSSPGVFSPEMAAGGTDIFFANRTVEDMEIKLAFCYSVIKNHGGVIYTETEAGKGVGFVVELPIFPEQLYQAQRTEST